MSNHFNQWLDILQNLLCFEFFLNTSSNKYMYF